MLSAIKQATAEFREKYQKGELEKAGANAGVKLSKTQKKIITLVAKNGNISQLGILVRKGSDKTGVWMLT